MAVDVTFNWLLSQFPRMWALIREAPIPCAIIFALICLAVFGLQDIRYRDRLETLSTRIALKDDELESLRAQLAGRRSTTPATPESASGLQRHLTKEQKELIADVLKQGAWESSSVWLRYESGCEECREFAKDVADALVLAGWNDESGTTLDEKQNLTGVKINVHDIEAPPQTARLLGSALRQAGIDYETDPWPDLTVDRIVLFIYRQTR